MYESFGWEKINQLDKNGLSVNLIFRRERNIENKEILEQLQEQCDKIVTKISKMEKKKHDYGTMWALFIAFWGLLAFGMTIPFLLNGSIVLSLPFFIIGIVFCIPPYFVYNKKVKQKTNKLNPKIDEKYAEINILCQKARNFCQE